MGVELRSVVRNLDQYMANEVTIVEEEVPGTEVKGRVDDECVFAV